MNITFAEYNCSANLSLDRDRQERLERPGNILGEGGGACNGQSRVEKMCCPMYRNAQDGLRSKANLAVSCVELMVIKKEHGSLIIHGFKFVL